jgi:hypothetical protein
VREKSTQGHICLGMCTQRDLVEKHKQLEASIVQKYENGIHTRTRTESAGRRTKLHNEIQPKTRWRTDVLGAITIHELGAEAEKSIQQKITAARKTGREDSKSVPVALTHRRSTGTKHLTRRHETSNIDYSSGRRKLIQHALQGKIQHRTVAARNKIAQIQRHQENTHHHPDTKEGFFT